MKNTLITILVVAALALGIYAVLQPNNFGSTVVGNDYSYQQLTGPVATTTVIANYQVALGSIIVTEAGASAVVMWDATSTAAITDGTYATRVADLGATLVAGTYTFDAQMGRGLVWQAVDGYTFAGDWTVTYR